MAKLSHSTKETSSPAELRERAKTIQDGLSVISDFFSEEVLLAICTAAADDAAWQEAMSKPQEFFAGNHLEVPDGVYLRFLSAPAARSGNAAPAGPTVHTQPPPPIQCPLPLVPTAVVSMTPIKSKLMEWHIELKFGKLAGHTIDGFFPVDTGFNEQVTWVCALPTDWKKA
jgi:hypothetical protein